MIDVDKVLQADAARWRTELPKPPELTASIAALSGREARRDWSRRRVLVAAAAAFSVAVVVLVVVAVVELSTGSPGLGQPSASARVSVGGRSVPYAGNAPWAAAIDDPASPRRLYVFADNDRLAGVCPVLADRAFVRETAASVVIRVAGYGYHSAVCDAANHAPVRTTVNLHRPLAGRTLIDSTTGKTHGILNAATVPAAHDIPTDCTTRSLTWDETTGVATRSAVNAPGGPLCVVTINYGRKSVIESHLYPGLNVCDSVAVNGATAQCWHSVVTAGETYLLRWDEPHGTAVQLWVQTPRGRPHALANALRIARSVR